MTFVDLFYFYDKLLRKYHSLKDKLSSYITLNYAIFSIFLILGLATNFRLYCAGSTMVYFTATFYNPISRP